jgi:hypothetical protein
MPLRSLDSFDNGIARRDRAILAFRIREYRLLGGGSALGILVSRSAYLPIRVSGSTNSVWCGLIGIGDTLRCRPSLTTGHTGPYRGGSTWLSLGRDMKMKDRAAAMETPDWARSL